MEKKQQEILDAATVLFSAAGIKKTSVNLISSNCGISKKTLYQFFENKEAIVSEIVKNTLLKIRHYIKQTALKPVEAPLELIGFFYFINTSLSVFTPIFINDITKFYPGINTLIIRSRTLEFFPFLIKNIDRGIMEGHYRDSINSRLTAELYFRQLDCAIGDNTLKGSEKTEILSCINSFFLHGILQGTGKDYLQSENNSLKI